MKPTHQLYQGDCLDILPTLEAGSVDCVIADPPYFEIVKNEWDRQWDSLQDYQNWIRSWAFELKRIVKHNGSIYVFCDAKVGAYVQTVLDEIFLLLNNIVWMKTTTQAKISIYQNRTWTPTTERILFYTPQYDSTGWQSVKLDVNNFLPLREYFKQYQEAIGASKSEIIRTVGQGADHCFRWNSTQWDLPTEETYEELGRVFPCEFLRREYEDLRREYEDLRRTWNTDGNTLDVIVGNIVTQKENTAHPTTKPIWLMERLITVSTNRGDTVLDFTMGSGTTGIACMRTGRNFIGVELDPEYFKIAETRIKNANNEFTLTEKERETGQLPLF